MFFSELSAGSLITPGQWCNQGDLGDPKQVIKMVVMKDDGDTEGECEVMSSDVHDLILGTCEYVTLYGERFCRCD